MRERKSIAAVARGADRPAAVAGVATERTTIDYGPLACRIGYLLRRAQVAVFADFHAAFAAHDIRPAQYSILTVLEHNPGLSQTRVADALGIRKANLVAMIDALEARGLAERRQIESDRRSHALYLGPEGRRLMPVLHRLAARHEQRIVELVGAKAYAGLFAPLSAIAALGGEIDET